MTSDFKLIARFFKNKRLGKTDIFGEDKICHVEEFMDFLSVFTDDIRYKEMKEELMAIEKEGGSVYMCNIADELEKRGMEKGLIKGIEQGIKQGEVQGRSKELVRNINMLMKNMKLTVEEALDALSVKGEERKYCLDQIINL